ncbi:rho GTPase-activating protein 45-like [Lingula anatina]|uniref:Rho GTPase-activating protein 45-like n=1 Tax=Lingula anatina TaxID=7574 RepID=A0A2R2MS65_LINAN|nr:rho GTPase-activating protein 45-like [Lingula anatina]|eukprot:XP_023933106.1 rho GTPase-activating protein 45-like [Lingula anatina]
MTSVGEKITHKIDKIGKALGSARAGSLSRKKKSRRDSTDASLGLNGNELDSPEPLFSPSSPGLEQREQRRPSISGSLVDSPKMASRLAHKPSKSNSLGSINSDIYDSSPNMDQDDIIALTQDVRSFSDALARLKSIFTEDDPVENPRIVAHEHLGKVLCILKTILQQYPALHSTDILTAAGTLISRIKSFKYEDKAADPAQFYDAIDQVALAFSSSVSEYLMGDVEAAYPTHTTKTRSFDNLSSMNVELGSQEDVDGRDDGQLGPSELDAILLRLESGVELALQRAKAWSKYAKDIMTYVEKKSTLESEYARNLSKIAQTMRPVITEEL